MKLLKLVYLFTAILCNTLAFSQFTDDINSNRPGESMMAFSVGKTVFQAEGGLNYIKEKHTSLEYSASGFNTDVALRYGLFKEQLEIIAELQFQIDKYKSQYLNEGRSGLKQTTFGAKYLFYDPFKGKEDKPNIYSWKANHRIKWKKLIPAVAGYAGINLNFSDNPFNFSTEIEPIVSPKVMIIAQNHFSPKWVMVTNIMYDKIATNFSSLNYVITITRGINDKFSVFFENQGYKSKFYSDLVLRGGGAYLLSKNIQIDASVGTSVKTTPSIFYGGIGASWRFRDSYKDIEIKEGKEVKDKKGDDKKNKDKKRLDEIPAGGEVPK